MRSLRLVSRSLVFGLALLAGTTLRAAKPSPPRDVDEAVQRSIERVQHFLAGIQRPDGSWQGLIDGDARASAQYLITMQALGRTDHPRVARVETYMARTQRSNGAWNFLLAPGSDLSLTRLCELSLRKAVSEDGRRAHRAARAYLDSLPELGEADFFLQIFEAIAEARPWSKTAYFTPRLISVPDGVHPNLYDLGFMRIAAVPMAVLQVNEKGRPRAPGGIRDGLKNLAMGGAMTASRLADRVLPPLRSRKKAVRWILERQEEDGNFAGTFQATSLCILALHHVDPDRYREEIERGLRAIHAWQVEDARGTWQQSFDGAIWDTAATADALYLSGVPADDPRLQAAAEFLVSKQSRVKADWSHRVPGVEPGGWAFERVNQWYPDVDDTGRVVLTLLRLDTRGKYRDAITRGLKWILAMQNSDGGWAAWDRDHRTVFDFPKAQPWMIGDPSYTDVTGRLLEVLAPIAHGKFKGYESLREPAAKAIRKGAGFLRRTREGSTWFGWWFAHYLYGGVTAVEGLRAAGLPASHPHVQETADWAIGVRNSDGGWGESPLSAKEKRYVPAASGPSQTAGALNLLTLAGRAHGPEAEAAAWWLAENQREDGSWKDAEFLGVGIPEVWYCEFGLVANYTVLRALLAYQEARGGGHDQG